MIIALPPFDKLDMPEVKFKITNTAKVMGTFCPEPHIITISQEKHEHFTTVLKTILHESCHLAMHLQGKSYLTHGKYWTKFKKEVAAQYSFDSNEI